MALFAIADPHLSFGTDKPMDVFKGWDGYVNRLEENWRLTVSEDDTVVVAGDISWGLNFEQALPDFRFLNNLPGHKLLLKGNHDYWWETRHKMDGFLEAQGLHSLRIVHNDAVAVDGRFAVCGTRGWFYDAEADADRKVLMREVGRLNMSLDAGDKTGLEPLVFLHYPPAYGNVVCEEMMAVLRDRHIRRCYYGHIHGPAIKQAINGTVQGVRLQLISGDYLAFAPLLIE